MNVRACSHLFRILTLFHFMYSYIVSLLIVVWCFRVAASLILAYTQIYCKLWQLWCNKETGSDGASKSCEQLIAISRCNLNPCRYFSSFWQALLFPEWIGLPKWWKKTTQNMNCQGLQTCESWLDFLGYGDLCGHNAKESVCWREVSYPVKEALAYGWRAKWKNFSWSSAINTYRSFWWDRNLLASYNITCNDLGSSHSHAEMKLTCCDGSRRLFRDLLDGRCLVVQAGESSNRIYCWRLGDSMDQRVKRPPTESDGVLDMLRSRSHCNEHKEKEKSERSHHRNRRHQQSDVIDRFLRWKIVMSP